MSAQPESMTVVIPPAQLAAGHHIMGLGTVRSVSFDGRHPETGAARWAVKLSGGPTLIYDSSDRVRVAN